MKKKAVQKIWILCSIEMLLLLLTPCVHPLSMEVFADPVTIQEYRQRLPILENNSELTAVPAPSLKFENDVDREQIEQEIRENIGKLDENGKQFKDYANSGSHNQNQAEGVSIQYAAEDLEPQTEPQLQDNPLNELEGRDGRTLDIHGTDNVITGYVYEGRTYETTFGASTQNPFYSEPATESATGTVSANIFNVLGPTSYEVYVETGAVYTEDGSESTGDSEAQSQGGFVIAWSQKKPGYAGIAPGSVISQGHPGIVIGIGGLAAITLIALLIYRKKKNTRVPSEDKEKERTKNTDEV